MFPSLRCSLPSHSFKISHYSYRSSSILSNNITIPLSINILQSPKTLHLSNSEKSLMDSAASFEENPAKKPRLPNSKLNGIETNFLNLVSVKAGKPEKQTIELVKAQASNDSNVSPSSLTENSNSDSSSLLNFSDEKIMPKDTSSVPRSISLSHVDAAWEHFRKLGSPKFHVAPMVDQSELPFRLLCRKYGTHAAYTPMYHSRLFAENAKYRKEFTTCPEDRPLFVQFCANDPDHLLNAAKHAEPYCDYVDINLGCPQRIAKRGNYGAFLMDDLPLVESLVKHLTSNLSVPVSCKIRVFPDLEKTLAYAQMLERAGCSLLAVHGRTRDQKDGRSIRADWSAIRAVKEKLSIPVIANGNIRCLEDAEKCMLETGADGVMSAESLLSNPSLFAGHVLHGEDWDHAVSSLRSEQEDSEPSSGDERPASLQSPDRISLMLEYFDLCEKYPVPNRMVRAHVHRLLGPWFRVHTDLRERLNKQNYLTNEWLKDLVVEMRDRNLADPSLRPLPENPAPIPSGAEVSCIPV